MEKSEKMITETETEKTTQAKGIEKLMIVDKGKDDSVSIFISEKASDEQLMGIIQMLESHLKSRLVLH